MITTLFVLFLFIVYLIIGRTIIKIFEDHDLVDVEEWKGFAILIFPLVAIWVLIIVSSEYLSDAVSEFFENLNKEK